MLPCPHCRGAGTTDHRFLNVVLSFTCACRLPAVAPIARSETAELPPAEKLEAFRPEWKKRKPLKAAPPAPSTRMAQPGFGPNVGDALERALGSVALARA